MSRDHSLKASKFHTAWHPTRIVAKYPEITSTSRICCKMPKQYILMISTLVPFFLTHSYVSLLFAYLLSLGPFLNNNYNEIYLCYWPPKFNSVLKFCCITTYYCDISRHDVLTSGHLISLPCTSLIRVGAEIQLAWLWQTFPQLWSKVATLVQCCI